MCTILSSDTVPVIQSSYGFQTASETFDVWPPCWNNSLCVIPSSAGSSERARSQTQTRRSPPADSSNDDENGENSKLNTSSECCARLSIGRVTARKSQTATSWLRVSVAKRNSALELKHTQFSAAAGAKLAARSCHQTMPHNFHLHEDIRFYSSTQRQRIFFIKKKMKKKKKKMMIKKKNKQKKNTKEINFLPPLFFFSFFALFLCFLLHLFLGYKFRVKFQLSVSGAGVADNLT
eukprot:TRINITY_DN4855_c0_g1_i2.p1 TRINITY_DN4855_c0_g1~~TRINITY_DN4855_c0_g1_i2.p1  ORF type:complete len:235 (-),score=20.73 TRINITY_DN4855_c0_g1_i2:247-951(-)